MKFAGVELTKESMQAARMEFVDNAQRCIDEVVRGDVRVNDPDAYFADCRMRAMEHLTGKWDHTFTFLQRAHTIQTGECVALLP